MLGKEWLVVLGHLVAAFVRGEEARITPKAGMLTGSVLTAVLLVAVLATVLSVQSIWAGTSCCKEPNGRLGLL